MSRVLESVPPVQGSGLANLWSGTKILQVVCYGKNEIKTNSHEQETKDEPETNDHYKIRQILIKIMEYTHIHIHHEQSQSSPTKMQYIDLAYKGNQKLYLPLKNKPN